MTRYAARTDATHAEVRDTLRKLGCDVFDASRFGQGHPDLIVSVPGRGRHLLEVKDGSKPPSARKLTPAEADFAARFGPVHIVLSADDAVRWFEEVREARA